MFIDCIRSTYLCGIKYPLEVRIIGKALLDAVDNFGNVFFLERQDFDRHCQYSSVLVVLVVGVYIDKQVRSDWQIEDRVFCLVNGSSCTSIDGHVVAGSNNVEVD
jgi:hypothetical protein